MSLAPPLSFPVPGLNRRSTPSSSPLMHNQPPRRALPQLQQQLLLRLQQALLVLHYCGSRDDYCGSRDDYCGSR